MKIKFFLVFLSIFYFSDTYAEIIIKAGKTPSGIEVWIQEDPLTPVITMSFSIKCGSVNDPSDREGTLALLTEMMQRGNTRLSPEKLASQLQDIASSYNYWVDQDFFGGRFITLKKYFQEMKTIFKESLLTPLFSQDNLDYVRKQHITGLRLQQSDPGYHLSQLVRKTLFKNHPYGRDLAGTIESVEKIDLKKDIIHAHTLLSRQTLKVVFAGNITVDEALKTTEDIFGSLPAETTQVKVPEVIDFPTTTIDKTSTNPQTLIQYFHRGLGYNHKDYQKFQILCSILDRLLREKVRSSEGLAYSIVTFPDNKLHSAFLSILTATDSNRAGKTINRIQEIFQNLKKDGLSEIYFQEAVSRLTGGFVLNFTTTPKIAEVLSFLMRIGKNKEYINKRNDLLKSITYKELIEFTDSFVQDKDNLFVVYGNHK